MTKLLEIYSKFGGGGRVLHQNYDYILIKDYLDARADVRKSLPPHFNSFRIIPKVIANGHADIFDSIFENDVKTETNFDDKIRNKNFVIRKNPFYSLLIQKVSSLSVQKRLL